MIDNTNREAETLGSVGPFVKVTWNDAASTFKSYRINAENPSEHLTVCETVGELVAKDDKAIVLVIAMIVYEGIDGGFLTCLTHEKEEVLPVLTVEEK